MPALVGLSVWGSSVGLVGLVVLAGRSSLGVEVSQDVLSHGEDGDRTGQAQGPGERLPLLGEVDAPLVEVHARASARQAAGRVRDEDAPDGDDAQQVGLGRLGPTAHARALRALAAGR